VRINQFDAGVFHWTRDSRFCLLPFQHARNSVCALQLVGRKNGIDVVKDVVKNGIDVVIPCRYWMNMF
jgi:hypothetical protein